MVVGASNKTKSNKTCFDEALPPLGFYYPSPQKSLGKNDKKIAIRTGERNRNNPHADSEGFATAGNDDANSGTFNESWPSTECDEYCEPLNKEKQEFDDCEFWSHNVAERGSLHHQDELATNSESDEPDSTLNSIKLSRNQNPISTSQKLAHGEPLHLQKKAKELLKSVKTLLHSENATSHNSSTNEEFSSEYDLMQNSPLDRSFSLKNEDVISQWRKGKQLKEKKPLVNMAVINGGQGDRNTDDVSFDSSEFLVSTEGLGRSTGTNESSEEIFHQSLINPQDTNESKLLNHYATDLPFSQYWKSNLNQDILYQWRIKRRIQLSRELAKSERTGFMPRVFPKHQETPQVGNSPKFSLSVSDNQPPQDIDLQNPWYSQVETSTRTSTAKVFKQPQMIPEVCIPQPSHVASSKLSKIPDCQFSSHRSSFSNIQSPTVTNYQEPPSLHQDPGTNQLESDNLRAIVKSFSSQREKVNAEVQTSPTSNSHSFTSFSPSDSQSQSCNGQESTCSNMDRDIPPSKHLSHDTENHTIPLSSISGSDQFSSGKTTQYHKYLVAEKPHCNVDSKFPSSRKEKTNRTSKTQRNLSKSDKFNGQRFRVNTTLENKPPHKKHLHDNSCESQTVLTFSENTNKIDSYHQTRQPRESSGSSNELSDDQLLFLDDQSSSDEEFSSDLILQHLRKQRSIFKEQLRLIDGKLKIILTPEKD